MRKRRTPPPDEAVQQLIVGGYLAGDDKSQLAARHHTTVHHVLSCLKSHGVQIRPRGEVTSARNKRAGAEIDEAELVRLIDERLSTTEIARRLRVTQPTVEMKMRRMGLQSKHGRGSPMEKNYFWKGGRIVDDDGYVLVKCPGHPHATKSGYVREHRLVMEKVLGRYLLPTEVVHHKKTGDRANNDPDNLEFFDTNADHLRHELTGRRPNYTPEGLERMRENAQRVNRRRYEANRKASETDAEPLP